MDDRWNPTMPVLRVPVAPPSRAALDRDERLVKDGILRMGSLVEPQIRDAIRAVVERDAELADARHRRATTGSTRRSARSPTRS